MAVTGVGSEPGDGPGEVTGEVTGEDATPASVSCSDFASNPVVAYDVAETAFPCTFEYPEVLAVPSKLGDPVGIVQFQRQVGDGGVLLNVQLGCHDGYTADQVTSIYSEAESFDYGDRTGYLVRVQEPVADIPGSQFSVDIRWETADGILYYGVTFAGQYATDADDDEPTEDCLTALDTVVQDIATSVAPNPDTVFGSTLEEG